NAEEVASPHLVGDVKGRDCVLVDDLTATGGTLIAASEKLKEHGASRIFAAVSHCGMVDDAYKRIEESCITELLTTDTIPAGAEEKCSKIRVLSVASLLGEAIRRIHEGRSVSSLFRLD
ncbi:MAG: ribose-phosphate diphosphokinase, partial [Candidatus Pacebacteria bacterium]|nr:ribose-phosphate diphosphokinase [Candidatus Paceibacterota bacterium]